MPGRKMARCAVELAKALRRFQIRHVNDQRVEAWTPLRSVNAADRFSVRRIGGKTVNRLCRHGDGLSAGDQARGFRDSCIVERKDLGHHTRLVPPGQRFN